VIVCISMQVLVAAHAAYEAIKHWFADHGTDLTAGACGVFCATEAAVTLGIGAPVCAAACALWVFSSSHIINVTWVWPQMF
jgi:hypothetical protein